MSKRISKKDSNSNTKNKGNGIKRNRIIKKIVEAHRMHANDSYKKGLLEINKQEDKYDKLFEQKLAEQYREFRNLKERHMLIRKLVNVSGILIIIILVALLLLSFS
jgi:hypothetical protein